MANIRQTIPNYIQGISQQPDELKVPGQVRDALNCIPDVTTGLSKRPGARLINPIGFTLEGEEVENFQENNRDGHWFTFEGEDEKSFIGVIKRDGVVLVWDTYSGLPEIVKYQQVPKDFDPAGNTAQVAFPECNSGKFSRLRRKTENLQGSIQELQEEINKIEKKLGADDRADASESLLQASIQKMEMRRRYDADLYLVNSGYAEFKKKYQAKKDTKEINPPKEAKGKGKDVGLDKVYIFDDKQYEKWLDEWDEYDNYGRGEPRLIDFTLGYGKIFGWIVENEDGVEGLDPGERERLERDLETLKEDLEIKQADYREQFAQWAQVAAQCGYSPSPEETSNK